MRVLTVSLVTLLMAVKAHAYACPTFAGHEWDFTGHLVNRVYPGAPDYESVTSGDEAVTRWYLQLAWPACFAGYDQLTRFQLILTPEQIEQYRPYLGKQITVKGTVEKSTSGRETTALVIRVSNLVLYEPRKQ
jgi:hypothetical protein